LFNLIILTEVLNSLGFRILNKFDTCDEFLIDLRILWTFEILEIIETSNYYLQQVIIIAYIHFSVCETSYNIMLINIY